MDRDHDQVSALKAPPRLTNSQWQIFTALTGEWKTARQIASDAGIATPYANEGAARLANQLVRLGLAEKDHAHRLPVWRHSATMRSLVR